MADHAGQTVEACAQPHDIEAGGERRIDHRIAVVGLVGRSVGFQSDGSLERTISILLPAIGIFWLMVSGWEWRRALQVPAPPDR